MKYMSDHHRVASRSIPERTMVSGTIATDTACMIIKGSKASIFKYSHEYEEHFTNGILTTTKHFAKGDTFVDADCYMEGIEATHAMMLQCYGYFQVFGPSVKIDSNVPSCRNDGTSACTITSTHTAKVTNASGDVSYHWEVTNASLSGGQGTDTIKVTTVGIPSIEVGILCTVTDKYTTGHTEITVTHERISAGKRKLVPRTALKPRPDLTPGDEN